MIANTTDVPCPICEARAGDSCTGLGPSLSHGARADIADRRHADRREDPQRLREALRQAVDRLRKHAVSRDDLSFIITTIESFSLVSSLDDQSARTKHQPLARMVGNLMTRITGCSCGWRTQADCQDTDTAYAQHLALMETP